ncbi:hypothetical protein [Nocardioides sp. AE5]|uniref:hypothetical protein n=1 Tax=Nocardioides sp. AE5 TaxID=2962573 RepID=UPI002880E3AD|nr:hypothetical protein [Nocardioides sp. AE5]MDT0200851.1 hypothetical protein [Nocardioides sp. AE5]
MKLRTRFARATAVGALVLLTPALTSCGMDFATDKVYTPAPGANDRSERVDVLNAVIVATADGSGTLVTTLVNNDVVQAGEPSGSADRELTTITSEGGTVEFTGPVTIKAAGHVRFSNDPVTSDRDGIDLPGIRVTGSFKIGDFVPVTLQFNEGEPVTVEAPVVPNNGHWACQDGPELTPNHLDEYAHHEPHTVTCPEPAGTTEEAIQADADAEAEANADASGTESE